MNLIDVVNQNYANPNYSTLPDFRPGDIVAVHVKIQEGAKSRLQVFQGTVVALKEKGRISGHFRVRKISAGHGVERVFPYHAPCIAKIDVVTKGKSRRAKHYFLRKRSGKDARVQIDYER